MASVFLGVRLPEKPYERHQIKDIDFSTKNVADLKTEAEKLLNTPKDDLEFIYCGDVLKNDSMSLQEYGVKRNSTIHVFPKQKTVEHISEPASEEQIQLAVLQYRQLFKKLQMNSLAKTLRPEVLRKIVDAFPEYQTNLGAYAILRDAVLISPMAVMESARKIAEVYPILVHSAEFVTTTIREHLISNKTNLSTITTHSEDSSDAMSSDSDSPSSSPNQQPNRSGNIRQISRDQLAAALMMAGSASRNSLSNIAQRNTSSGQQPSTSGSSTSTAGSLVISRSLLSGALSHALLQVNASSSSASGSSAAQNETPMDFSTTAPTAAEATPEESGENLAQRYASELQTMREMGLFDELANVQALAVSNGDVEAAINLVLSGLL